MWEEPSTRPAPRRPRAAITHMLSVQTALWALSQLPLSWPFVIWGLPIPSWHPDFFLKNSLCPFYVVLVGVS